jgi:hypothetical protein
MLNSLIEGGKLAPLEPLYKINKEHLLTSEQVYYAAGARPLGIAKWAVSKNPNLLPRSSDTIRIAKDGNLEMPQRVFEQKHRKVTIPCDPILQAALEGHVPILEWAYKFDSNILQRCRRELYEANQYASENGRIGGAKWLHSKKFTPFFHAVGLSTAVENGHLNVLKLARKIKPGTLPTGEDLNNASAYLDLIKWVDSKDKTLH